MSLMLRKIFIYFNEFEINELNRKWITSIVYISFWILGYILFFCKPSRNQIILLNILIDPDELFRYNQFASWRKGFCTFYFKKVFGLVLSIKIWYHFIDCIIFFQSPVLGKPNFIVIQMNRNMFSRFSRFFRLVTSLWVNKT